MQTMAVGISWMRHQTDMENVSKATKDGASQQPEQEAIKRELGELYYLFSLSFTILPSVASEHVEIAWTGAIFLYHIRGKESHRNEKRSSRILRIPKQSWVRFHS
jgi:hypothetical protein